jgi:hypothetical protein
LAQGGDAGAEKLVAHREVKNLGTLILKTFAWKDISGERDHLA